MMRAWRSISKVDANGTVRLESLPFEPGQSVEIIVLPAGGEESDLALAADTGLNFWNNEIDDRIWNDTASSARPAAGLDPLQ